jgi:hypothetical protein
MTFYPAGFDNEQLITVAAGDKGVFGIDNPFKARLMKYLANPSVLLGEEAELAAEASAASASLEVNSLMELESEQEWLSKLHDFINKGK